MFSPIYIKYLLTMFKNKPKNQPFALFALVIINALQTHLCQGP